MHQYLSATIIGLIGTLFISGCSANAIQTSPDAPVAPSRSPHWHSVGTKGFLLQGKITAVDMGSPEIKLQIHRVIPDGPPPAPKFPHPMGSTVAIHFKHPLPAKGTMEPTVGELVQIEVNQYTRGTGPTTFLGSGMAHGFYFKKNGKYVNADGEQPVVLT